MPEHDHSSSQIVLVPLSGTVELRHDGESRTLSAGSARTSPPESVSLSPIPAPSLPRSWWWPHHLSSRSGWHPGPRPDRPAATDSRRRKGTHP
ncbi:hypothetical protein [Streptomyces sp. NBC_00271]|uniref:hypothetical protein n=1 Tax=Streptomyces sp. NBC_00271 TaxID=2975697 RepID=UPI002E2D92E2|nr:hypothetical protein [Streptomyces sp. NBC_00271]